MCSSVSVSYTSGGFDFSLDFSLFKDAGLSDEVEKDSTLEVNTPLWARFQAKGITIDAVVLVLDRCWATPDKKADGEKNYQLITKG